MHVYVGDSRILKGLNLRILVSNWFVGYIMDFSEFHNFLARISRFFETALFENIEDSTSRICKQDEKKR